MDMMEQGGQSLVMISTTETLTLTRGVPYFCREMASLWPSELIIVGVSKFINISKIIIDVCKYLLC